MILKNITMTNFRQYVKTSIDFSYEDDRNVTLIMGDNGSGKTTLAQAFLWCLYGETDFKIKEVINRKVRDTLSPNESTYVEVSLQVNHNNNDYTIKRRQKFTKKQVKIEEEKSILMVSYKLEGNSKFMSENEQEYLIKHMLPKELSRFFFFDGERIREMSEEINEGKSKEFKDAVSGLVGLRSIQGAIQHLRPSNSPGTVIGTYKRKIDESGDSKLKTYTDQIIELERQIQKWQNRLSEIEPQIENYKTEQLNLNTEILSATPQIELKKKYEKLETEIIGYKNSKKDKITKMLLPYVSENMYGFVVKEIINKSAKALSECGSGNQGIPSLQAPALQYLLREGKCICGEPLVPGEPHYESVHALMDFVPPKSLGTMIKEVETSNRKYTIVQKNFNDSFDTYIKSINEIDEFIQTKTAEAAELFNSLSDTTSGERAKAKLFNVKNELNNLEKEQISLIAEIKVATEKTERIDTEKGKLVNVSENNQLFIRALAYAQALYGSFSNRYGELEEQTRQKLEAKIDEVFPQIYEGGMKIQLDDKYNISVFVDDDDLERDELEKNTAQSYSVIFSFITSVIAMAKEKARDENDTNMEEWEKEIFKEAEGYPLVMDAPLSNFDKTRIEQICKIIPGVAKQVVFFIKDTDGEVAERYMSDKIGKKYVIYKVNNSQTYSKVEVV